MGFLPDSHPHKLMINYSIIQLSPYPLYIWCTYVHKRPRGCRTNTIKTSIIVWWCMFPFGHFGSENQRQTIYGIDPYIVIAVYVVDYICTYYTFCCDFKKLFLFTVGKRNYFTGYGILLHELPVVAILFIQINNNEGTMKNSVLHGIYCKSLFRTSRPIVK